MSILFTKLLAEVVGDGDDKDDCDTNKQENYIFLCLLLYSITPLRGIFLLKVFHSVFVFTHFTFSHVVKMCNKVGMDAVRVRKFYLTDMRVENDNDDYGEDVKQVGSWLVFGVYDVWLSMIFICFTLDALDIFHYTAHMKLIVSCCVYILLNLV